MNINICKLCRRFRFSQLSSQMSNKCDILIDMFKTPFSSKIYFKVFFSCVYLDRILQYSIFSKLFFMGWCAFKSLWPEITKMFLIISRSLTFFRIFIEIYQKKKYRLWSRSWETKYLLDPDWIRTYILKILNMYNVHCTLYNI